MFEHNKQNTMSTEVKTRSKRLQFSGEIPVRALIEALRVYQKEGFVSCALEVSHRDDREYGEAYIEIWDSLPQGE